MPTGGPFGCSFGRDSPVRDCVSDTIADIDQGGSGETANLLVMPPTPEFAHMQVGTAHDLREALTLSKGWLEAVLKNWKHLEDHDREAMVAAALFGTNRIAFLLDIMEGSREEDLAPAPERVADDFERLSEPTSGSTER